MRDFIIRIERVISSFYMSSLCKELCLHQFCLISSLAVNLSKVKFISLANL